MNALIGALEDPERSAHADEIQAIQGSLGRLQYRYRDHTLAFKALGLAYEALRLAWYSVKYEGDGDHLGDVEAALRWVKGHLGQAL